MQKTHHCRCLTELKIGFRLRVWNTDLTLVLSLQIKPRKCSAGKYVWHSFWKGERCLCRSNHPKRSLKKVIWEISQNSQENICVGIFFSNKVKLCISAASLKTRYSAGVFLRICRIRKKTFFPEHHQTTTSD